jgi:hypothetical protein
MPIHRTAKRQREDEHAVAASRLPVPSQLAYAAVRQDHCHLLIQRAKGTLAFKTRTPKGQLRYAKESCGNARG